MTVAEIVEPDLRPPDPLSPQARPERWALFLDVDGTLVAICDRPEDVRLDRELRACLGGIQAHGGGALALVSGRRIAELDRLFAPLRLPAAGLHGLEHRGADGRVVATGEAGALDHLRAPLQDFAGRYPGVWVEDKGRGLALHFRQAPAAAADAQALVQGLAAGEAGALRVLSGKMVIEIKPAQADKGSAVAAFMAEPPFAGRIPVVLGDDVTDEDAFAEVNARGGLSIRVGPGESVAARRLPDEVAVADWLARLDQALRGRRGGPA